LLLWYERACIERGHEKLLDLQLLISPHTENPNEYVRDLRQALQQMTESSDGS
jgi:hypothetical protein